MPLCNPFFSSSRFGLVTCSDQQDSKKCDICRGLMNDNVMDLAFLGCCWQLWKDFGHSLWRWAIMLMRPSWYPIPAARHRSEAILDYPPLVEPPDDYSKWVTPCEMNPRTTKLIPIHIAYPKNYEWQYDSAFKSLNFEVVLHSRG